MSYAIIQLGGKQFLVEPDLELTLDSLPHAEGSKFEVSDVLFVSDGQTWIGQPTVSGAKVELSVLKQTRSPKLRVAKFKAKSRYRRTYNHRQLQTVVKVIKITAPKKS